MELLGEFLLRRLKVFSFLILSFLILIGFQNCLQQESSSESQSSSRNGSTTLEGNGGGYVGKSSFLHIDLEGVCTTIGGIKQKIIIDENDEYFLTVNDCEEIVPQKIELDPLAFLPHNQGVLLNATEIYQNSEGNTDREYTRFVCRGDQQIGSSPRPGEQIVDFQIHENFDKSILLMDAIVGVYSMGDSSFITDQLDKKLATMEDDGEKVIFQSERTAADFFELLGMSFPIPGMSSGITIDIIFLEIDKATMRGRAYTQSSSTPGDSRVLAEGLYCFRQ